MVFLIIIFLAFLILVHELGHFSAAKIFGVKVEEFGFGFPPRLKAKKIGETLYSLNLLPLGGFVKIFGLEKEPTPEEKLKPLKNSFLAQPFWRRFLILSAGVLMNIFFAWLIFSFIFMMGSPFHLLIAEVNPNSPAQINHLKPGDIILKISQNGQILEPPLTAENVSQFIKSKPDAVFDLTIKREGKVLNFQIQGRLNPPKGEGALGIVLADIGSNKEPFFKAIFKATETTFSGLKEIVVGFFNFFSRIFVNAEVLKSLAGPVGIFSLALNFSQLGLFHLLQFIAWLSLNLAVLNFLPFPALDGGQIIFLLIEKIKGSPVPFEVQRLINSLGLAALLILMLLITLQDIGRIL